MSVIIRLKILRAGMCTLLLTACTTVSTEPTNPVTWTALTGWSDTVRFDLYDLVCDRPLRDLRLRPGFEVSVTACGNENGVASIRYRRERIAAAGRPWTTEMAVRPGQLLILR